MPVYDQGYRRYEARGPLRQVRFWPITREALRLVLARRAFLFLLVVAWLPWLVRVIQIFVVTRFPDAGRVIPVDGRLFGEFLNQQLGWVILISIFGGAGLVANDVRSGALLVYLSRPLTHRDYVAGKLSVLLALNLGVTLVPGLLLYLFSLVLAPDAFVKWKLLWIAPAVVLHALLLSLVTSLLMLAVSAVSRSARAAGLAFFALLLVLEMLRGTIWFSYREKLGALLSVQGTLRAVGNALFGVTERGLDVPVALALGSLLLLSLGCLAVLRARVRAVEIVR